MVEPAAPVTFRPDASYLISGGLGGLGVLTARWMVAHGARTLVLASRHASDQHLQRLHVELESTGARIVVRQADVAQDADVKRLLDEIAESLPPLRGVVHAAGVLDDGAIRQLNWQRFTRVLLPKLAGGWNLHCLTAGMELDFFVQYSSFTSIQGTPGQGNHAAANAFLDALAWYRRGIGLPALSINWGPWSEVGAAADRGVGDRIKAKGGDTLTPEQGLRLLERTWHAKAAQVSVVPVHWARMDAQSKGRPLLRELMSNVTAAASPVADVLKRLRSATPQRRRALLLDHILAETAKVLGIKRADTVEPHKGFFELGMDSLTSVELRNRLNATLQCTLPITVAFDHPTPDALARFVLGEIEPAHEAPSSAAQPPAESAETEREIRR